MARSKYDRPRAQAYDPVVGGRHHVASCAEKIVLHIRFKGGATKTLTVALPLNAWQQRATRPEVIRDIDRLLEHNTFSQIASELNRRALLSGEGRPFTPHIVARIRRKYGLASRYDRLRKAGMLRLREMAVLPGITPHQVRIWHRHGILRAHAYTDKNECLYKHPGDNPPHKAQGMKLSERCRANEVASTASQEVQCEA